MSKIKSPQAKKALSLKRDKRNVYGENPTSSRKNIRRGKQRSHKKLRHAVGQVLHRLRGGADEDDAVQVDFLAKLAVTKKERSAFKKEPDTPLGIVIERKLKRRRNRGGVAGSHL